MNRRRLSWQLGVHNVDFTPGAGTRASPGTLWETQQGLDFGSVRIGHGDCSQCFCVSVL